MTRKDHEILAAAIRDARHEHRACPKRVAAIQDVAENICDRLEQDNPLFKRELFLRTCH